MSQQLWTRMANLVFELEKKLAANESPGIKRTVARMKDVVEEAGILILNPLGEPYAETRTDLEANIVSPAKDVLFIVDVIKPVLYVQEPQGKALLQKGVVIVGSKA
jgi:hypothetical protein